MSKIFPIFVLLVLLVSCKKQFVEDVNDLKEPLIFYEQNDSFITTKNGLISFTRKLYSNKDTSCSSIFKSENILFKTDFNGKILWERMIGNSIPEYALEVENGSFYKYTEVGKEPYLIKTDSVLNEKTRIKLEFNLPLNDLDWLNFKHIKNGKFFGFGRYILRRNSSGGEETYKQVFCILDKDNGVEKIVVDNEILSVFFQHKYEINSDGSIYGLAIYGDYNAKTTSLNLRKYDSSFILKLSSNIEYKESSSININNVIFKNNQINILFTKDGQIKFLNFNEKFERKDADLGGVSNFYPRFVQNGNDRELLFTGNNFLAKITQAQNTFVRTDLVKLDNYYNHNFIGINNIYYSIYNSGQSNKPQITFNSLNLGGLLTKKTLFKSQFERNCFVK